MEPKITFTKNQEVRRKRHMRVLLVLILLVIAALGAGIGFLRKSAFQISQITISGTYFRILCDLYSKNQRFAVFKNKDGQVSCPGISRD